MSLSATDSYKKREVDDREQTAAQLAENRALVGRMTRNPAVLRTSVSEDAKSLWKELLIAGIAHEKSVEDWRPYCEPGTDEGGLYLQAREEADSSPLGKDDPELFRCRTGGYSISSSCLTR